MLHLKFIIIIIIVISVAIPIAYSFTPSGKNIWFNIEPAKNDTRGGVFSFNCPAGELAYAIFENGTFACRVP